MDKLSILDKLLTPEVLSTPLAAWVLAIAALAICLYYNRKSTERLEATTKSMMQHLEITTERVVGAFEQELHECNKRYGMLFKALMEIQGKRNNER